jgi:hypothetical protein
VRSPYANNILVSRIQIWLKVDPQSGYLINAVNASYEGGNLVFELVCHFTVTQKDAKPSYVGFKDTTTIPPVGSHVVITGLCSGHQPREVERDSLSNIKVQ